jgi:hypothetical protein
MRRWSPILEFDPDREIVAIDVERDVDVLGVQIRTGRIVKAFDFAACKDESPNGVCITRSALRGLSYRD